MNATAASRRLAGVAFALTLTALAGCGSMMEVKQPTVEETAQMRQGPEARPQRSITSFAEPLRCMDGVMLDYGVRDVSMLAEELVDETKKVNAGTRDMLISAVSDMTRRSRGIRLIAFGKDTMNMIGFLSSAQRAGAYAVVPQYDIKGSVSQFDENLIRNQKDFGIGYSPFLTLGVARDAASSVLALDLSLLSTSDMSVLPGVTSRNSVVILKGGKGMDGDAAYSKFGINFSMNLVRSEGQSQALRGLVELASIELVGKLTKTPYWRCLGVTDPMANEETRLEMSDWYHAMAATRVELIAYFQNQLRRRGYYDGPIDGEFNPALDEAISNYREALGLPKRALLDEAFFYAFLAADHAKIPRPAVAAKFVPPAETAASAPAAAAAAAAAPAAASNAPPQRVAAAAPTNAAAAAAAAAARPAAETLRLLLATTNNQTSFASGEPFGLVVRTSRDAYVYCYLVDEKAKVMRLYPNRFAKDARVAAAQPLQLPGKMRFQLAIDGKGARETIACFATPRDVLDQVAANVVGTDFEPLPVASLDQVRAAFVAVGGSALAQEVLHVQAR